MYLSSNRSEPCSNVSNFSLRAVDDCHQRLFEQIAGLREQGDEA
jgi:hypothetical protein